MRDLDWRSKELNDDSMIQITSIQFYFDLHSTQIF